MTFVCPKCGRTQEVCTAKATVVHVCPAVKPRPALTTFVEAEVRA